jgi:long-chain acyl-CoA synthetase
MVDPKMLEALAQLPLGELLRRTAARVPDRPALLSDDRQLTWAELDAEVDRVAGLLQAVGVGAGDGVGFIINKRPEVVTGFLACARVGAVMAPVNFKLHPDHIRDQFTTAGLSAVFVEKAYDGLLKQLLPHLPDPHKIIYVDGPGKHGETAYEDTPGPYTPVGVDPDSVVYLNYTSGTTGRPKGAMTTHRQINFNALTAFDRPEVEGLGFDEGHTFLGMFSVFAHPHELFHRSLLCGGPFVIMDSLSPRVIAETIERFKVTWMMAVPSFYEMLLDHVDAGALDLSSLRVLEEKFKAGFMPVWGCTEATGVALAMRPDRPRRPGSSGKPVNGYGVRIVDDRGRDCAPGETGELIIRGPAVALGYINQPAETAAAFRDGWYHTSDLMTWTEDGFVQFVGRRSEMLKVGGIRVYPLEIERVIKGHPEVRDVVVVRAEERIRGEIPRAVVECYPGSELTVKQVKQYCRDRMAVYQVPRIIEFWKEIPKLPNGKINKRAVVEVEPDPARDER